MTTTILCPLGYTWCHHDPEFPNWCGGTLVHAEHGGSSIDLSIDIQDGKPEFEFDIPGGWRIDLADLDKEMADLHSIFDQMESSMRTFKSTFEAKAGESNGQPS